MFAGDHGDCAKHAGNDGKMACTVAMADLNLTPNKRQDGYLDGRASQGRVHERDREKVHARGQRHLSPEQFAKFKGECKGEKEKPAA